MIPYFIQYKWWFLLFFESIAWICTFYMFYARYWLNSNIQFIVATTLAGVTGYVPHIILAILDYLESQQISFFIIFILSIIVIGATLGKKYVIKIDNAISMWAEKKKIFLKQKSI